MFQIKKSPICGNAAFINPKFLSKTKRPSILDNAPILSYEDIKRPDFKIVEVLFCNFDITPFDLNTFAEYNDICIRINRSFTGERTLTEALYSIAKNQLRNI